MEKIGERIRSIRESENPAVSQAKMAKRLKVSAPTYARYEAGGRVPPADFLQRVVEESGADATWLLMGTGTRRRQGIVISDDLNALLTGLNSLWKNDEPDAERMKMRLFRSAVLGELICEQLSLEPLSKTLGAAAGLFSEQTDERVTDIYTRGREGPATPPTSKSKGDKR